MHPKSIQKVIKNMMRFWMRLGWLLEGIFGGFWDHLGGQVGAKLTPKSIKMESKMTSKKEVEKKKGKSLFGRLRPVRGVPWEGDIGGGINGSMDQSYSISTRQWAKGPANYKYY